MKAAYTARELADLRLPGLPGSERGMRKRAGTEGWQGRARQSLGGGTEYPLAALPADVREAVLASGSLPVLAEPRNSTPCVTRPGDLKGRQREVAHERVALVRQVERLADDLGSVSAAIDQVAAGGGVSAATLWRWRAQLEEGGFTALAPRGRGRRQDAPAWVPALLKVYRTPAKRSVEDVLRDLPAMLPPGVAPPSVSQARRYLRKMSAVERNRGRMGPNALKSVRAFVRRTTSGMAPGDVYISDGHTFDAEVAHPRHGQPCRPEITTVLDVATRKAVGWSAALAESTWAVADALRHACESHGIPATYYADHGPGQENAVLCAMLARIGVREERSIARNSQARGVIERFNRNLVAAAKRLPTYMGADMDQDAKNRVYKLTRRDLRLVGTSRLLLPWDDSRAFVAAAIDAYNQRPHRALGKGTSPDQAWQRAMLDGWEPMLPSPDESADLFRPYELRKCLRGEIALHGKRYFAKHLEHVHGEQVLVGYDIHDPSRVWVRDERGRLLAIAELDGNAQPYFPKSSIEQAREQRALAQLKRLEAKRESIVQDLADAPRPIEAAPAEPEPQWTPELQAAHQRLVASASAPKPSSPDLIVELDGGEDDVLYDRVRRLEMRIEAGEEVPAEDRAWVEAMRAETFYALRRDFEAMRARQVARKTG